MSDTARACLPVNAGYCVTPCYQYIFDVIQVIGSMHYIDSSLCSEPRPPLVATSIGGMMAWAS